MKSLLDGRLAPIGLTIGFIEADARLVASVFAEWQSSLGIKWKTETVTAGSLEPTLLSLLPLTGGISVRELFIPTNSPWTAFFTNAAHGTDAQSRMSFLAGRIGCRGLRVDSIANTIKGRRGRYGSTALEIFGPQPDGPVLNYIRSIIALNDGGRWVFELSGTPQPFEEPEHYTARRVRDRFTPEMLDRYLQALQIDAFNEEFYRCSEALLLSWSGPLPASIQFFSLEEARAKYGA